MLDLEINEITSLLAMLTSLIAVIVGPYVTFKVVKKQITVPLRHKWAEELKELIASFLVECRELVILGEDGVLDKVKIDRVTFSKLLLLEEKLRLTLDDNQAKHHELLELIDELVDEAYHGAGDLVSFGRKCQGATKIAKEILDEEWIDITKS